MSAESEPRALGMFLGAVLLSIALLVVALLDGVDRVLVAFLGGLAAASAFWLGLGLALADEDPEDPEDPEDGPGPDPDRKGDVS